MNFKFVRSILFWGDSIMNTTSKSNEDIAKEKVLNALKDLDRANKESIKQAFDEYYGAQVIPSTDEENNSDCKIWWPFFGIFFGMIVVVLVLANYATSNTCFFTDEKTLLIFLAFVVTLSAYLASVIRDIQKRLSEGNVRDPKQLKKNMRYIAPAEISLVIISLMTVLRLLNGPFLGGIKIDPLLLSYLAVTVVYMAGLHARIWLSLTKPWLTT